MKILRNAKEIGSILLVPRSQRPDLKNYNAVICNKLSIWHT